MPSGERACVAGGALLSPLAARGGREGGPGALRGAHLHTSELLRRRANDSPPPAPPPRAPPPLRRAGSLTELQQLKALDVDVRSAFVARLPPALAALLQAQTIATPLLLRFNKGLAPHVIELRAVLELPQFAPPAITTGTQNQDAGASGGCAARGQGREALTLRRAASRTTPPLP
jgi:hypothetical protein